MTQEISWHQIGKETCLQGFQLDLVLIEVGGQVIRKRFLTSQEVGLGGRVSKNS